MKMTRVESSNIASIGYDEKKQTLAVEFLSGDVYTYTPVPPEVYKNLMEAESKGRFFYSNIRNNNNYQFTKL